MLKDAMGHRWDGTRINNTGLQRSQSVMSWKPSTVTPLDRRGDALRAAGVR
jgi:hypothetical protein